MKGDMMNYLLVMPKVVEKIGDGYMFPPGIAYVSASMKKAGLNVINLNLNHEVGEVDKLVEAYIKKHSINVVLTGGLSVQYSSLKKILAAVKSFDSNIVTIIGGGIITSNPEPGMLAIEFADYGIIGEGEFSVVELCHALEKRELINNISGLIYLKNGRYYKTEERVDNDDLDELEIPDYEGFQFSKLMELEVGTSGAYSKKTGIIIASRSCPFQCTFCFHPSGKKYRQRSLDNVFKEIDFLVLRYDIKFLSIADELFSYDINRVKEFCERIKIYKIEWSAQFRVSDVNEEMVRLLKDANCVVISYGIESADNSILKSMRKNTSVEQIEKALELTYDAGIGIQGNFIFGDINETMETANNTLKWWNEHRKYGLSLLMIRTFPGTYIYKYAVQQAIIKDEVQFIKDGCLLTNVSKLSETEYRNLYNKLAVLMGTEKEAINIRDTVFDYENNKVAFIGECVNCKKVNHWEITDVFDIRQRMRCRYCGQYHSLPQFKKVRERTLNNIEVALKKYSKIAFWGMGKYFMERLYTEEFIVKNENIYLIDASPTRQGNTNLDKAIHSPKILQNDDIRAVIVAVPYLFDSIEEQILNEYKYPYKIINMVELIK